MTTGHESLLWSGVLAFDVQLHHSPAPPLLRAPSPDPHIFIARPHLISPLPPQILGYKAVQERLSAMSAVEDIGWLRVSCKTIKSQLSNRCSQWVFKFTGYLQNRVTESIEELYDFVNKADKTLDIPVGQARGRVVVCLLSMGWLGVFGGRGALFGWGWLEGLRGARSNAGVGVGVVGGAGSAAGTPCAVVSTLKGCLVVPKHCWPPSSTVQCRQMSSHVNTCRDNI